MTRAEDPNDGGGGRDMAQEPGDPILEALRSVERALDDDAKRGALIRARIAQIRQWRESGVSYSEIVRKHDSPLVVSLITDMLEALATTGHELRRVEAEALYGEGLTMEQIASVFGVSRQRVSVLLRTRAAPTTGP